MSFLNRVLRKLHLTRIQSTSLVLVQRPDPALNGTWLQSPDGKIYHHKCICAQEHQLPATLAAALSVYTCGGCKQKYSLVRAIDAVNADDTLNVRTQALEVRLNSLPVRHVERSAPAPRHFVVGEESNGEVTWTGAPPASGVTWR
jgi:hypothetical protein